MKFKITCPCGCYFVIDKNFSNQSRVVHCPNCDRSVDINAMIDLRNALKTISNAEEQLTKIDSGYSLELFE